MSKQSAINSYKQSSPSPNFRYILIHIDTCLYFQVNCSYFKGERLHAHPDAAGLLLRALPGSSGSAVAFLQTLRYHYAPRCYHGVGTLRGLHSRLPIDGRLRRLLPFQIDGHSALHCLQQQPFRLGSQQQPLRRQCRRITPLFQAQVEQFAGHRVAQQFRKQFPSLVMQVNQSAA